MEKNLKEKKKKRLKSITSEEKYQKDIEIRIADLIFVAAGFAQNSFHVDSSQDLNRRLEHKVRNMQQ